MCGDAMKGRNGKIHRQPVTTATKFSNCLIDWLGGGSTLALFAAEFSLELYYLRTKVYLSQVAFARIRQSMALQTASFQATLGRRPFRTEMVAKEWLTYQTDTFQVTI